MYHIYITMNDFIGGGQTVYEIFRTVRDREETYSTQYPVGNGVHELYINLEIPLGDDSELDHLLRYIKETTENPNLETEILEVGDGLAISKMKSNTKIESSIN